MRFEFSPQAPARVRRRKHGRKTQGVSCCARRRGISPYPRIWPPFKTSIGRRRNRYLAGAGAIDGITPPH